MWLTCGCEVLDGYFRKDIWVPIVWLKYWYYIDTYFLRYFPSLWGKILHDFCFFHECSYHFMHHDWSADFSTIGRNIHIFCWTECYKDVSQVPVWPLVWQLSWGSVILFMPFLYTSGSHLLVMHSGPSFTFEYISIQKFTLSGFLDFVRKMLEW